MAVRATDLSGREQTSAPPVKGRSPGGSHSQFPGVHRSLSTASHVDYEAAARFWSDTYIQHSAHIRSGREGLFKLVRSLLDMLRYEHGSILSPRATTSSCTAASRATDALRRLSRPISYGSKKAVWPNIGTCFKTTPHRPNRRAGRRCSESNSPADGQQTRRFLRWAALQPSRRHIVLSFGSVSVQIGDDSDKE
jgi:hypothetical protein